MKFSELRKSATHEIARPAPGFGGGRNYNFTAKIGDSQFRVNAKLGPGGYDDFEFNIDPRLFESGIRQLDLFEWLGTYGGSCWIYGIAEPVSVKLDGSIAQDSVRGNFSIAGVPVDLILKHGVKVWDLDAEMRRFESDGVVWLRRT